MQADYVIVQIGFLSAKETFQRLDLRLNDDGSIAVNDINNIRMAVGMGMVALTDAIFLGSAAICFMAYINIKLTAFVLIPMPLIVISTRFFSKKMHRRYQAVIRKR